MSISEIIMQMYKICLNMFILKEMAFLISTCLGLREAYNGGFQMRDGQKVDSHAFC